MLDCRESIVRLGDASVESQSMRACQTLRSGGEAGRLQNFRRGRKTCYRFRQRGASALFSSADGRRADFSEARSPYSPRYDPCRPGSENRSMFRSRQRAGSSKFSQDVPPKIPVTVRWGDGTKVREMTELSKEAGIGRRSLCRALSACRARCQPFFRPDPGADRAVRS